MLCQRIGTFMFPICKHVAFHVCLIEQFLFSDFRSCENSLEHVIISSQFHLFEAMNVYAVIVYWFPFSWK